MHERKPVAAYSIPGGDDDWEVVVCDDGTSWRLVWRMSKPDHWIQYAPPIPGSAAHTEGD